MATLEVYSDANPESSTVDGYVEYTPANETWTNLRQAGTGSSAWPSSSGAEFARVRASSTTDRYNILSRSMFLFDTSSLPDNCNILEATLQLYVSSKQNGLALSNADAGLALLTSTPASDTDMVAADFDQFGTTRQASDIAYNNITTSAYNTFTLNATGRGNINKTGITKFGVRMACDLDNNAPTWSSGNETEVRGYFVDRTGSTEDPKLTIVYTTFKAGTVIF